MISKHSLLSKTLYDFYALELISNTDNYATSLLDITIKQLKEELLEDRRIFINEILNTIISGIEQDYFRIKEDFDYEAPDYITDFESSFFNTQLIKNFKIQLEPLWNDFISKEGKNIKDSRIALDLAKPYIETFYPLFKKEILNFDDNQILDFFNSIDDQSNFFVSEFGGFKWAELFKAYLNCLNTDDKAFIQAFDHFIDLSHNTGSILSKFSKEVQSAIENKKHFNIKDFIPHVSSDVKKVIRDYAY